MPRRPTLFSYARAIYTPFLDPVFLKDLEALSRRWRIYVARMIFVGMVGAILLFNLRSLGPLTSSSVYASLGRSLFAGLVTFQMAYVVIAVAFMAADLLLREARSGTLLLMLLTPLSGWRIAHGKWKAAMAHAVTLLLAGLPPLGITAYLGGVGLWDLLWSSSLSFALAGISSALALYFALSSRTAVRATVAVVATLLLTAVVLLIICGVGFEVTRSPWFPLLGSLLHPLLAAGGAAFAVSLGELSAFGWIGSSLLTLIFAQVLVMSTAGHLSISKTLDELVTPRGLAPSESAPGLPSLETRSVWHRHPLLWRELALQSVSRQGWTRRTTLAAFALPVLLLASTLSMVGKPTLEGWLVVLTVFSISAGAGLFTRDKENRHLDVLLTLPVTSADLVGAKLLSGVWNAEGVAYVFWMILFVGHWASGPEVPRLSVISIVAIFALFSYVLAALASLGSRSFRGAFLSSGVILGGFLLGLPRLGDRLPGSVLLLAHPVTLGDRLLSAGASDSMLLSYWMAYAILTTGLIVLMIVRYRRQIR